MDKKIRAIIQEVFSDLEAACAEWKVSRMTEFNVQTIRELYDSQFD